MCLLHSTVHKAGVGAKRVLAYPKALRVIYRPSVRFCCWGGSESKITSNHPAGNAANL